MSWQSLSEWGRFRFLPACANAEAEATELNQSELQFMLGVQKMVNEEWVFLSDEMLEPDADRVHLFD